MLVSAKGDHRTEGFDYALDNGAWWAYQQGKPFDEDAFEKLLTKLGADADWTCLPDIVAGGTTSLAYSLAWKERVMSKTPRVLLAVQDGMVPEDVQGLLGRRVGLFIGGTTEWKLQTMPSWAALGRKHDAWVHVGRVNTARRIHLCSAVGATSIDGTSASRFASTIPMLDGARRQLSLPLVGGKGSGHPGSGAT